MQTTAGPLSCITGQRMNGSTVKVALERLGITASKAVRASAMTTCIEEALFRTCKYRPD